ncbi:hypothetical protein J2789_006534 [Variovorax paradoxus]|nr:hypothetical protein [Variovorax paradoxus]
MRLKLGNRRRLDAAQETAARKLITGKTPDQLKMGYTLWTRAAVGELVEQRFGGRLPVHTEGCLPSAQRLRAPEALEEGLQGSFPRR